MKRCQITVFIIGSIIILFSAFLLIFLTKHYSQPQENTQSTSMNRISVQNMADQCLSLVGEKEIKRISLTGDSEKKIQYAGINVSVYKKENHPTKEELENEISKSVKIGLQNCIVELDTDIKIKDIKIDAKINDEFVVVSSKLEIDKKVGKSTILSLESFKKFDISLGKLHDAAELFISEQENEEGLLISKLIDIADKNNLQFEIKYLEQNFVLISLIDNKNFQNTYSFAMKMGK